MKTVALIIFDGVRAFDYAVVDEVWGPHRALAVPTPLSELRICAPSRRPIHLTGGLRRTPAFGLDALAECDLVIVPGLENPSASPPKAVITALRSVYECGIPV